ncbi:MAG TPA: sugar phosphate isomerase/epimerase family protein [Vicinamibacterales bacterium]|nr:sugar phosphate isomerase/epimerase family protein [Vicinamibacterales bacterium]
MSSPRFGVSTHLYHDLRLDRDHLVEIAAHGFDTIEVFATRSHFDYHDGVAVRSLAEWLEDTRMTLNSVHAPIAASLAGGVWGETYSFAATDAERRRQALAEAEAALAVAQTIPFTHLVVHLGVPDGQASPPADNNRDAARRAVEALLEMAERAGVRLALEVIPNKLSSAEALVSLIENDLEGANAGICMDVGHAFLLGDVGDAIETCAEHLITTHLHDNRKRTDDHLTPGEGKIDWPLTLMSLQKIGYDGAWMFELANTSTPKAVLEKADRARRRFEQLLDISFENPASIE